MTLEIATENIKPVQQRLIRLGQEVGNFTDLFEDVHRDFKRETRKVYQTLGGDQPWAPLSPAYQKWKRRFFPGKRIGRRTDRLWRAATGQSGEHVALIRRQSAEFGVSDAIPYAAAVQERRPYLQRKIVDKAVQRHAIRWVREIMRKVF